MEESLLVTIIGVRFKKVGKIYYFDPRNLTVKAGEHVIVETARGIECGVCATGNTQVEDSRVVGQLKPIIRIATDTDMQVARGNERQAREAHAIARRKIEEHKLDMRLVAVECTFDLNKILFYFTAEGRVDFRDLVKDLASIFRTRIELRQIGVRDEAKMIGGLGICGRELCCASYLEDFAPVSINMAKEQNLSLNPVKISGTCGRLMCCLKYEYEAYVDLQKHTPRNDSLVETPDGLGTVMSTQMLRSLAKVRLEDDPENPRVYHCDQLQVLRNGRAKKNPNQQGNPRAERSERVERPAKPEKQRSCSHNCGTCSNQCASRKGATPEIDPLLVHEPVAVGMPPKPSKPERPRRAPKQDKPKQTSAPAPVAEAKPAPKRDQTPRCVVAAPQKVAPAPKPAQPNLDQTPRCVVAAPKKVAPAPKPEQPNLDQTPRCVVAAPKKEIPVQPPKAAPAKREDMPRLVRSAPTQNQPAKQATPKREAVKNDVPRRVMAAPQQDAPTPQADGEPITTTMHRFRRPQRPDAGASQVSITPAETIRVARPAPSKRPVLELDEKTSTVAPTQTENGEVKKKRRRRGGNRNKPRTEGSTPTPE